MFPKIGVFSPKMDGENNGNPIKMDDLGFFPLFFWFNSHMGIDYLGDRSEIRSEVCKALVDLDPLLSNVSRIQGYADTLQDIVERFKDAWNF